MSVHGKSSDKIALTDGGFALKSGPGSASLAMECPHQNGLLYVVPGDRSWVCEDEVRPAHALESLGFVLSAPISGPRGDRT